MQIFSFGFYFSFQCDLTLRYKEILQRSPTNEQYYWNGHLFKLFREAGISRGWMTPVVQGYFACFQSMIAGHEISYALISRRSKYKSGTRFYARGLDDEGYCANSVETEQVVKVGDRTFSHVMLRASVPVFWEQRSVSAAVTLTRNKELTKAAFTTHFQRLHKDYGRILCINLLEREKSDENLLIKAYELMFSECFPEMWEYCRYNYYDLHDIIKKKTP